jgi:membrane fusion protein (multidrug efflux system)
MKPLSTFEGASPRAKNLRILALVIAAVALTWGAWYGLYAQYRISTDNAYVVGNVIQITPQTTGTIMSIQADETDWVQAGQPLIKLDPTDAKLALEQARLDLIKAVRDTAGLFANAQSSKALLDAKEAEAKRAHAEFERARDDVQRRSQLVQSGAVSQEEWQHAQTQLAAARNQEAAAQSAALAAREQWTAANSQTQGLEVTTHPNVERAAARVREAYLALARTDLKSPVHGHVAKRSAQVGQRVQPGTPLMSVVALDQIWVDANFKESQLANLRIGQPAELEADVYGHKVTYHGKVAGLGAGTGAAFALLPAQNATGNWIKVVQRVPVRIQLDAQEVQQNPLRVGLSMDVTVQTSDQNGKRLADAVRTEPVASTAIYDAQDAAAQADIQQIIANQLK